MNLRDPDLPHLNAEDLERNTSPEVAACLPLICNEEDCHVATSELDSGCGEPFCPPCVA